MSEYQGTLHIYAQEHEHGLAHLLGTRETLLRLADACRFAAAHPEQGVEVPTFAADGEGYVVVVQVLEEAALLTGTALPYAHLRET